MLSCNLRPVAKQSFSKYPVDDLDEASKTTRILMLQLFCLTTVSCGIKYLPGVEAARIWPRDK